MVLIIDNYDSFTYNLYQALAILGEDVQVVRNDAITINKIQRLRPSGIVLSPGPGHPAQAGICVEVIKQLGCAIPILGVCLGHQAIGIAFGATIVRAIEPMHGKSSLIFHNGGFMFKQVHMPFQAGRYHSLVVDRASLPLDLMIEAEDIQGSIMAMRHRDYPIYGVQFHPESILTPAGEQILRNFMRKCNATAVH